MGVEHWTGVRNVVPEFTATSNLGVAVFVWYNCSRTSRIAVECMLECCLGLRVLGQMGSHFYGGML